MLWDSDGGRFAVILYSLINIPYWLALSYLMQDPIGIVLIFLAFLVAGLCVGPLKFVYMPVRVSVVADD
jgi:hypothetical protein